MWVKSAWQVRFNYAGLVPWTMATRMFQLLLTVTPWQIDMEPNNLQSMAFENEWGLAVFLDSVGFRPVVLAGVSSSVINLESSTRSFWDGIRRYAAIRLKEQRAYFCCLAYWSLATKVATKVGMTQASIYQGSFPGT